MSILIKGMEMPESCDGCKLKSCGYCDITNRLIPYDGSRHGDCPLVEVPDEQPDRNAQERYEDLCEYFKDCSDKGIGIVRDRKEFKAWLERLHWHVVRCDELGRELEKLQSAQPEPCVDTIDALNESIKHFDDLAEECRRNANIERNDYMDMRDDAAEYRQLSIWLNELKWLRERFQSQSEQKWIPVSKKLPKEDVPVLVTDDAGGMATVGIDSCGRYEDTGERFWYTSQNVTAWMYTVEPYGGEQE